MASGSYREVACSRVLGVLTMAAMVAALGCGGDNTQLAPEPPVDAGLVDSGEPDLGPLPDSTATVLVEGDFFACSETEPCFAPNDMCCDGRCINPFNDVAHCGGCGKACEVPTDFCAHGACTVPPCQRAEGCTGGSTCCGETCCLPGEICCSVPVVMTAQLGCYVGPSCPPGCYSCPCAAPDTMIATPEGNRPIDSLQVGDWVYGPKGGAIVPVPVLRTTRCPVVHHQVVELMLDSGAILRMSVQHPTADGRTFAALTEGDLLDGVRILSARVVPYLYPYTVDILPASDDGSYLASGVRVGSTLAGEGR